MEWKRKEGYGVNKLDGKRFQNMEKGEREDR